MMTLPLRPDGPDSAHALWHETHVIALPARAARTVPVACLPSGDVVKRFLARAYPGGIYQHQADAAGCAADFTDFAVTTGTASGKTLCFHLAALEALSVLPDTKVVVLYPQKALGAEQEGRWRDMLGLAGVDARVGRIDGSVPVSQRALILDTCRVVILTPDVMHAWLLGNLASRSVRAFIRATRLMIIDEVHTFTGVFGSNAAYLFRRYEHALRTLTRKKLQYVCASATIQDPAAHLTLLTGRTFTLIGPERDGSPRQPVSLYFLRPTEPPATCSRARPPCCRISLTAGSASCASATRASRPRASRASWRGARGPAPPRTRTPRRRARRSRTCASCRTAAAMSPVTAKAFRRGSPAVTWTASSPPAPWNSAWTSRTSTPWCCWACPPQAPPCSSASGGWAGGGPGAS